MQSGFLDAILDKSRKILLASKSKAFIKFKYYVKKRFVTHIIKVLTLFYFKMPILQSIVNDVKLQ